MSVLNRKKKPTDNVQVWDGYKFSIVTRAEAKKLVEEGTHQLTENLSAPQLKYPHQFKRRDLKSEEAEPLKVDGRQEPSKGQYKQRMMKAEE